MKKIDYLCDRDEILKEIAIETDDFSVSDFYLSKNLRGPKEYKLGRNFLEPDGALQIITPNQNICCYSWQDHRRVCENVFDAIYPSFNGFWVYDKDWHDVALDLGNVCVQYGALFTIVWIPEFINKFQFDALVDLLEEATKVNEKRRGLINYEIIFDTNIFYNNMNLSLDEAMSVLPDRVSDNVLQLDEIIIDRKAKVKKYDK